MASRTRGGLMLPVVLVVVLVVVFGVDRVIDTATGVLDRVAGGIAVLGMGEPESEGA